MEFVIKVKRLVVNIVVLEDTKEAMRRGDEQSFTRDIFAETSS